MSDMEFIAQMNANAPPALKTLGGKVMSIDLQSGTVDMHFVAGEEHSHSDGIIQGGFVAGMLDAAMAHAVFVELRDFVVVATLEIKVSYLQIARIGSLVGRGRVIRLGKTVGFLEADLLSRDGDTLARASSTARIIRKAPATLS